MKWIIYVLCFLFWNGANAQESKQISKKRKQLKSALHLQKQQLRSTHHEKNVATYTKRKLSETLEYNQHLLDSIQFKIEQTNRSIQRKQVVLNQLKSDTKAIQQQLKHLLQHLYRQVRINQRPFWLSLLSAASFKEAFQLYSQLKALEQERRNQIKLVLTTINDLEHAQYDIAEQQQQYSLKNNAYSNDQKSTKNQIDQQITKYKKLKAKEKSIRDAIIKKQQAIAFLNRKIEQAIQKEVRLSKQKSRSPKRKYSPTTPLKPTNKPFLAKKGRLPWPIRGKIIRKFGNYSNPDYPGIQINNNGIDILNTRGNKIKSIAEGTVNQVFATTNRQNLILIQHGAYFSCYTNLSKVYVKVGDKINSGQPLGEIAYDLIQKGYVLHFELWAGTKRQNPLKWLVK